MPSCVVKGCKNHDRKVKKEHGISYHRFPNDPTREEIWIRIIRKQRKDPNYKPQKNTRICSAHFCDKDFDISKTGLRRLKASAKPRIEIPDDEVSPATPAQSFQVEEVEVDMSDLIFDTRRKAYLNKRIEGLEKRQSFAAKKIKCLQRQNARLKKKNKSLQDIIKILKQRNQINEEIGSALGTNNVEIAEITDSKCEKMYIVSQTKNKPT